MTDRGRASAILLLLLCTVPILRADPLYVYTLHDDATPAAYDEAIAVASLQGLINRDAPLLYIVSSKNPRPQFWLDVLSKDNHWLASRPRQPIHDLSELINLAGPRLKGRVIWDPGLPATVNIATTIAGVEDAIVLSPSLADRFHLPMVRDLRGMFTGSETGSRKNDAYRWAIRNYLDSGRCSGHLLCLFEDSYSTRSKGDIGYAITRDWAAKNRAFVFDLSPWTDEAPKDDPHQKPGTDFQTFQMILSSVQRQCAGRQMTEMTGFSAMEKYAASPTHPSAHQPVPTEWETVWQITPYNVYQNTISSDCFNQSVHSQAPYPRLKQVSKPRAVQVQKKSYVCILMADYDSATPLYDFLPKNWNDAGRGKLPLAWGVNPNLVETFPDLFDYYYRSATGSDTFTSDASCAGYVNPNRIQKDSLGLFVKHNQKFFGETDMTVAPMVLDQNQPSAAVKDAFAQFAPGGMACLVDDMHHAGGGPPLPQVWKRMVVTQLFNDSCNAFGNVEQTADIFANGIYSRGNPKPGFYLFRTVWVTPTNILDSLALLRRKHPDLDFEVVGPREFFQLFKQALEPSHE